MVELEDGRQDTPQKGPRMSTASRILALSVSLTAILAISTGSAGAADLAGQPLSVAKAAPGATRWRALRHARCELIQGVRGASPLTVPFFGSGWYPGPARYYGPPGQCCPERAVISVRY